MTNRAKGLRTHIYMYIQNQARNPLLFSTLRNGHHRQTLLQLLPSVVVITYFHLKYSSSPCHISPCRLLPFVFINLLLTWGGDNDRCNTFFRVSIRILNIVYVITYKYNARNSLFIYYNPRSSKSFTFFTIFSELSTIWRSSGGLGMRPVWSFDQTGTSLK